MRLLLGIFLAILVSAPAQAAPARLFEDDRQLLHSGTAARERTLDQVRSYGVEVIRVQVWWRRFIYPDHLEKLDALVAAVQRRGMRVMLNPTGPGPPEVAEASEKAFRGARRPDPAKWAEFVRGLGARYPTVRLWALWNEPNHPVYLSPQREGLRLASPALYRELFRSGRAALEQTGHGGDTILIGDLLPTGRAAGENTPVTPIAFLRELFCLDRRSGPGCSGTFEPLRATGLAFHGYYGNEGPLSIPFRPDEVTPATLARLRAVVAEAARRGRIPRRLPLWDTESGVQTSPPDRGRVSLARQARYINEAEYMAWATGGIRTFAQYLMRDDRRLDGFQSGLRFVGGRAKPALAAYRLPVFVPRARGGRALVWGRANGTVAIEVDGRRVARVRARGYFTKRVRPGRRYRLRLGRWASRTISGP